MHKIDKLSFMNKGSKPKVAIDSKFKVTIGSILITKIDSKLNINMYVKLKRYYKALSKEINKEP